MVAPDLTHRLKLFASELRPLGSPFVSIVRIAQQQGTAVFIRLHRSGERREAQIDFMSRPPRIVVFRRGSVDGERVLNEADEDLLTARERFSIAHELGHWIACQEFHVKPGHRQCEYWVHEECVNAFAAGLLVPDWLVNSWLRDVQDGELIPLAALRRWAAAECRVSEEVIASVICEKRRNIGFMKVLSTSRKADGASILRVLFSKCGDGVFLPKVHSHIADGGIRELLNTSRMGSRILRGLSLGKCPPQDLRVGWRHAGTQQDGRSVDQPNRNSVFWVSLAVLREEGTPELWAP